MVNHPNRAAVTLEYLAKNIVSVNRRFRFGTISYERTPDGWSAFVPYFVVNWAARTVSLTLDRDNKWTSDREHAGVEEWLRANPYESFWDHWMERFDGSPEMGSRSLHLKKGHDEAQRLIVDAGREAQVILDSLSPIGEVSENKKKFVLGLLNCERPGSSA